MKFLRFLGSVLMFLFTGLLIFTVFLVLVIVILVKGPSLQAREIFVHSCEETSALKFLPRWFLPDEEVDRILAPVMEEPVQTAEAFVPLGYDTEAGGDAAFGAKGSADGTEAEDAQEPIVVEDIRGGTYVGKMMIVSDPKRVVIGTLPTYGEGVSGRFLPQFIEAYEAVGGTNAGGFEDPDGHGKGGIPDGIVIENGEIRYGSAGSYYRNIIGLDADGKLHVGHMTGAQALSDGIVTGVSFSPGEILVQDGVPAEHRASGLNPRTAIGQRADGAMLLLVIEGRHAGSLGASYDDLRDEMVKYGAVTASMLDGGTSSAMYYEGEQITRGSNLLGMRLLPTTILVLPEVKAG